jgi:hypothetical protein
MGGRYQLYGIYNERQVDIGIVWFGEISRVDSGWGGGEAYENRAPDEMSICRNMIEKARKDVSKTQKYLKNSLRQEPRTAKSIVQRLVYNGVHAINSTANRDAYRVRSD